MVRTPGGSIENVLVDDDTSGLERLRADLLVLSRDQVQRGGEGLDSGRTSTHIVDLEL